MKRRAQLKSKLVLDKQIIQEITVTLVKVYMLIYTYKINAIQWNKYSHSYKSWLKSL